jgi:hypothetical protein
MSWYQIQDGSGSMMTGSSSPGSAGVCASIPVSAAVQNAISPVTGVDQPVVFVVGLDGQSADDLLQIDAAQVQHQPRIGPAHRLLSRIRTPDQRHDRAFLWCERS